MEESKFGNKTFKIDQGYAGFASEYISWFQLFMFYIWNIHERKVFCNTISVLALK